MKHLLYLTLLGPLLGAILSSCSTVSPVPPVSGLPSEFEFLTEATRVAGRDKAGNYEDYILGDTRVRFYSTKAPSALRSWRGVGTDGEIPNEILTKVSIRSGFGDYDLPAAFVIDLAEPTHEPDLFNGVRLQQDGAVLRIAMENSDGAGFYRVFFVVDLQEGKAQRYLSVYVQPDFTRTHDWTPLIKKGEQGVAPNA